MFEVLTDDEAGELYKRLQRGYRTSRRATEYLYSLSATPERTRDNRYFLLMSASPGSLAAVRQDVTAICWQLRNECPGFNSKVTGGE